MARISVGARPSTCICTVHIMYIGNYSSTCTCRYAYVKFSPTAHIVLTYGFNDSSNQYVCPRILGQAPTLVGLMYK